MRTVLQRARRASVVVEGEVVGAIEHGLVALVGVEADDGEEQAKATARRIRELRIFEDGDGKMNRDVAQVGGGVLLVSQFTLAADLARGRRPSFSSAAPPDRARHLIAVLARELASLGLMVAEGRFGASMAVELVNDGPVTFVVEI